MVAGENIESIYKQNLEQDIIKYLAEQILKGENGIENMDPKYLAEDLIENEGKLFQHF